MPRTGQPVFDPSEISLDFLCSLVPNFFSGERNQLNAFISDCDNAIKLSSEENKYPLFRFIYSRITGKARDRISLYYFDNWDDVKTKLIELYQDKKPHSQLIKELTNRRQKSTCIHYEDNTIKLWEKLKILEVTESKLEVEEKTDPLPESKLEVEEKTDSLPGSIPAQEEKAPSTNLSKKKAKEAPLLPKNKNKKKGLKVKEVKTKGKERSSIQNSNLKNNPKAKIQKKTKISNKNIGATKKIHKHNFGKHTKKRKWNSSTKKSRKKASILMSTDFHEESIPEVKLFLLSKVHLSSNEKEKIQISQKLARGNLNKKLSPKFKGPYEVKKKSGKNVLLKIRNKEVTYHKTVF